MSQPRSGGKSASHVSLVADALLERPELRNYLPSTPQGGTRFVAPGKALALAEEQVRALRFANKSRVKSVVHMAGSKTGQWRVAS